MKQRAIKRCIRRAQKGRGRIRHVPVSFNLAGSLLTYKGGDCILHIKEDDIVYQGGFGGYIGEGHTHWIGVQGMIQAVSYA